MENSTNEKEPETLVAKEDNLLLQQMDHLQQAKEKWVQLNNTHEMNSQKQMQIVISYKSKLLEVKP